MVQFNPLGMSQSVITSLTLTCLYHLLSGLNWQPEQLSTGADNRLYLVFPTANRSHVKQELFLLLPIADALSSCHIRYSIVPSLQESVTPLLQNTHHMLACFHKDDSCILRAVCYTEMMSASDI